MPLNLCVPGHGIHFGSVSCRWDLAKGHLFPVVLPGGGSGRRRADCAAHGHSAAGALASGRAAQQVYNAFVSLRRFPE